MLVLFDIDGTLLQSPSLIHMRAVERACWQVHRVMVEVPEVGPDALNGLTSPMLGRLLLRDAGVDDAAIDGHAQAWREAMTDAYLALQHTMAEQRPIAGARDAIASLAASDVSVGLLTGNLRAIAYAKLRHAGIWHDDIDLRQGAFADDAEDRDKLGRIARRRHEANAPGTPLVIVGDTPRDIACARAAGAEAIAVTTGGFAAEALAGADLVASSLSEALGHLLGRRTPGAP